MTEMLWRLYDAYIDFRIRHCFCRYHRCKYHRSGRAGLDWITGRNISPECNCCNNALGPDHGGIREICIRGRGHRFGQHRSMWGSKWTDNPRSSNYLRILLIHTSGMAEGMIIAFIAIHSWGPWPGALWLILPILGATIAYAWMEQGDGTMSPPAFVGPEPDHISFKCHLYRSLNYPHTPCSGTCDHHSTSEEGFCDQPCKCECHPRYPTGCTADL